MGREVDATALRVPAAKVWISTVPATADEIAAHAFKFTTTNGATFRRRSSLRSMTLAEQAQAVTTRAELGAFVVALAADLQANPSAWENCDLPAFLGALAAWVNDMNGYYRNLGENLSTKSVWNMAVAMLMAARVYE